MRKKHRKNSSHHSSDAQHAVPTRSGTEFYSSTPAEKPLFDNSASIGQHKTQRTSRHRSTVGRREEKIDPREKMALLAILKAAILLVLILVAFVLLWKGIGLYNERIVMEHMSNTDVSPVLKEIVLEEDFDISDQNARQQFAARIELWKEADRLVRSADALLQRNIYDQAIARCQEALLQDPAHMGALERLGQLYFEKGDYVKAVNAYIRLLSVDPSRADVQKRLIQALDAYGDADAVMYMTQWYQDQNTYDGDIQRYLANALYEREEFVEAAEAYARVLRDSPRDVQALERQVSAYMQIKEYEKALVPLAVLRENNYRKQDYYKQIAICNAQLLKGEESLKTLGRAAQLFDKQVITGWIRDPQFDPIRTDRAFQAFTERLGGEEFRLWLEKMAKNSEADPAKAEDTGPELGIPGSGELLDKDLLKPKQ